MKVVLKLTLVLEKDGKSKSETIHVQLSDIVNINEKFDGWTVRTIHFNDTKIILNASDC